MTSGFIAKVFAATAVPARLIPAARLRTSGAIRFNGKPDANDALSMSPATQWRVQPTDPHGFAAPVLVRTYHERIHNSSAIASESLRRARLDHVVNSSNDAENQRPVFTFKSKLYYLKSIVLHDLLSCALLSQQ